MMNPTDRIHVSARLVTILFFAAVCVVTGTVTQASEKPNILIFFTDDKCESPTETCHKDAIMPEITSK